MERREVFSGMVADSRRRALGFMATDDTFPDAPGGVARVCRKCSAISTEGGAFCPHCGTPYVSRRRRGLIPAVLVVVTLLAAGGAAVASYSVVRADHRRTLRHYQAEHRHQEELLGQAKAAVTTRHQQLLSAIAAAAREDEAEAISQAQQSAISELEQNILQYQNSLAATDPFVPQASRVDCIPTESLTETTQVSDFSCLAITAQSSSGIYATTTQPQPGTNSGISYLATYDFVNGDSHWSRG